MTINYNHAYLWHKTIVNLSETPFRLIWTFNARKSEYLKFLFPFLTNEDHLKETKFSIFFVNTLVNWYYRTVNTHARFDELILLHREYSCKLWNLFTLQHHGIYAVLKGIKENMFYCSYLVYICGASGKKYDLLYLVFWIILPTLSYFQPSGSWLYLHSVENSSYHILHDPKFKGIPPSHSYYTHLYIMKG